MLVAWGMRLSNSTVLDSTTVTADGQKCTDVQTHLTMLVYDYNVHMYCALEFKLLHLRKAVVLQDTRYPRIPNNNNFVILCWNPICDG